MVALLEEFPGVRVTFNLVPSLLVQVQAFAEDRAQDRHLELGLKPAARLDAGRSAVAGRQRLSCAVRADDRPVSALRRAARAPAWRGGRSPIDDLRDLQVWHKLAWMDPDCWRAIRGSIALVAEGQRLHRSRQARCCEQVELELLRARDSRLSRAPARAARSSCRPRRSITRSCRCCATPTRTCARIRTRRCRARRFARPGMRGADRAGDRVPRGDVRQPAARACGRRKARCRTRRSR